MRRIGLLGGMSWESTATYYRLINEAVRDRLGGLHSAELVLVSVDFAGIEAMQMAGDWVGAGDALANEARALEAAGAECVLICTNTMHKVADVVTAAINVPLLHLADATAAAVRAAGVANVGLLGTRFTMEETFYRGRVASHGLSVQVPEDRDRETVHRVIYEELCQGEVRAASRLQYLEIINRLVDHGAGGIIAGCTEIGLLVSDADCPVPLFDTTAIHAQAAVDWALGVG